MTLAPHVCLAKRLLRRLCNRDQTEVVTIAISFTLKESEALPGPAVIVNKQADEKASYDSDGNVSSEDSGQDCHDIGILVPLTVRLSPQDGLIRQGGNVVVSLTAPKEYRDRICTKVTTLSVEPLPDDAEVTGRTAACDAPSRPMFTVFRTAPKHEHRWSF
ncbi:hypothetical protein BDY19DRAFT_988016 [Irpex rosettiformis]|uniref:Uncharacterized protein n=1 Tax=Irpex rosettiformis TaxID=378272 RepID=A0ACB8UIL3_9APHY|nr:hypothetical protein BDY19DRAFT_988016 [Irpex rosettiformis]